MQRQEQLDPARTAADNADPGSPARLEDARPRRLETGEKPVDRLDRLWRALRRPESARALGVEPMLIDRMS